MNDSLNTADTSATHDKQLHGISLEAVMEKRRLDQALNAKEFSVCAGVSYSTARSWFHLPDFPAIHGVVFWLDFVQWRSDQHRLKTLPDSQLKSEAFKMPSHLSARADALLREV